jgi:hypothetical protein
VRLGAHASSVQVCFDDGVQADIDLADLIRPETALAGLDDPAVFRAFELGPRGRSLRWPGDVELCADALWLRATK